MENTATAVRASIELALEPSAAFEVILEELAIALEHVPLFAGRGGQLLLAYKRGS